MAALRQKIDSWRIELGMDARAATLGNERLWKLAAVIQDVNGKIQWLTQDLSHCH